MAAYDFPPTAGEPTDGSFTYTAPTGEIYSWNGYSWVMPAGPSTPNAFVKKSGDTMTGDLTVPNLTVTGVIDSKQVAKAYGRVDSNNILSNSYNIGSTVYDPGALQITFAEPMTSSNYVAIASFDTSFSASGNPAHFLSTINKVTTGFTVIVRTMSVDTRTSVANEEVRLRDAAKVAVAFVVFSVD